jgi:DNA-binding NarL/FixJ family response regulator
MRQAAAFRGAILVSFWRLAGMSPTEGTPVEWLLALPAPLITIRCSCEPEVAAERFRQRMRHPGHLDGATPHAELMVRFRALACLEPLHVRLEQLGITPRELNILEAMAAGLSNREIAEQLFVSENTVKTHAARLFEKLSAQRRTQAVQRAKEAGLIP